MLLVEIAQSIHVQDSLVGKDVTGIVSGDGDNNVILNNNSHSSINDIQIQ